MLRYCAVLPPYCVPSRYVRCGTHTTRENVDEGVKISEDFSFQGFLSQLLLISLFLVRPSPRLLFVSIKRGADRAYDDLFVRCGPRLVEPARYRSTTSAMLCCCAAGSQSMLISIALQLRSSMYPPSFVLPRLDLMGPIVHHPSAELRASSQGTSFSPRRIAFMHE